MNVADRYLELMRQALTRSGQFAPAAPITGHGWKRHGVNFAQKMLSRRGFTIAPLGGPSWMAGETMIGTKALSSLQDCIEDVLASGVAGDLVETGVWRGGTTIFMRAVLAAHEVENRTVWAADSFEGFPARDDGYTYVGELGHLHELPAAIVTLDTVKSNFARYGLLDDQVRFLVGWFADTLKTAPISQISVLRLDGDRYDSTSDALTALEPRVSPGGYVIVDDYGVFEGCRRAVDEYRQIRSISEPMHQVDEQVWLWKKGGQIAEH